MCVRARVCVCVCVYISYQVRYKVTEQFPPTEFSETGPGRVKIEQSNLCASAYIGTSIRIKAATEKLRIRGANKGQDPKSF
jgi:hypothetical protein